MDFGRAELKKEEGSDKMKVFSGGVHIGRF